MTRYPDELVNLARQISQRNGFVQGAGGNISYKTAERMWVKASGTRLSEADSRNIFVELDLPIARTLAATSEDFSSAINQDDASINLRPSIETSLHSLLPHTWVAHVHSVGLLGSLISENEIPELETVVPSGTRVIDVPYVKPGLNLSRAVFDRLGSNFDSTSPAVVLLRNHGFVVASDDLDELVLMLEGIEESVRPATLPSQSVFSHSESDSGWNVVLPAGTVTANQAIVLSAGPYTPDETVFLGDQPFALVGQSSDLVDITESTLFAILEDGAVLSRNDAPKDAIEIGLSAVDFVSAMRPGSTAKPLTHEQIDELINWDAEKWRKAQQK